MLLHLLFCLGSIFSTTINAKQEAAEDFVKCMSNTNNNGYPTKSSKYIYSTDSPSYFNILKYAEHNPRWLNQTSLRPKLIVTPRTYGDIKAAITCANQHRALQIRVMSGGHDYEGLSYASKTPFVLVNLVNLRSITIDTHEETAWVQAGATLGELYYSIAQKSHLHGFPAGLYPSVGVGGHFSGGGLGTMLRKHGLAADHVVDAKFMDARGRILDRKSMGEDLFWAIRGGGGASFGVILAWKVKLVRVPPVVTVFTVTKDLDQRGLDVVNKWQHVASTFPNDLFIRILLLHNKKSINAHALFNSLYLGNAKDLLTLTNARFPELGLREKDCTEMSWINSTLYFYGSQGPLEALLNRTFLDKRFKGKSDFVEKPLSKSVYRGIKKRLEKDGATSILIMDPFGGRMDEIEECETPFPHRKGNLFNIQYLVKWNDEAETKEHLDWIKEMYEFMEPHVSSSPRAAYLNYRDLDIGFNKDNNTTYQDAELWGTKYFKANFKRLAKVKKAVDPDNFFRDQQTIPPIS